MDFRRCREAGGARVIHVIRAEVWIEVEGFDSVAELVGEWPVRMIEREMQDGIHLGAAYGLSDVVVDARVLTQDAAEAEIREEAARA